MFTSNLKKILENFQIYIVKLKKFMMETLKNATNTCSTNLPVHLDLDLPDHWQFWWNLELYSECWHHAFFHHPVIDLLKLIRNEWMFSHLQNKLKCCQQNAIYEEIWKNQLHVSPKYKIYMYVKIKVANNANQN